MGSEDVYARQVEYVNIPFSYFLASPNFYPALQRSVCHWLQNQQEAFISLAVLLFITRKLALFGSRVVKATFFCDLGSQPFFQNGILIFGILKKLLNYVKQIWRL